MTVTVLLFDGLRTQVGTNEAVLDVPDLTTVSQIRDILMKRYPVLSELLPTAVALINQEIGSPTHIVHSGDEIAFTIPVKLFSVTVLLFATLKERAGIKQITLDIPDPATVADVRNVLTAQFPALLEALPTAIASVNREFAFPTDAVHANDEIAFFPPVSGGSGEDNHPVWPEICLVAPDPIDLNELTRAISTPATGAVCLFSGAVRGETNADGSVVFTARLEYEAYEPMAIAKMRQVIAEIREQWPLVQGVAVVQRVGLLVIGEPTVLIACASGHRDQGCFPAARYGIDRLKEIVPIWKKEIRPDGDRQADQWVEGHYRPTPDDVS